MEKLIKTIKSHTGEELVKYLCQLARHKEQFSAAIRSRDLREHIIINEPVQFQAIEELAREYGLTMIPKNLGYVIDYVGLVLRSRVKEGSELVFCKFLLGKFIEEFGERFVVQAVLERELFLMTQHVEYLFELYPELTLRVAEFLERKNLAEFIKTLPKTFK